MVDKAVKNAYIWYSGATDITGQKLAKALGVKHGRKKPTTMGTSMVIGWGAKTSDPAGLGALPTLNHPDRIKTNRNKLAALDLMKKAGVSIAPYIAATEITAIGSKRKGDPSLPVIGRTKYHQGGKGFWNCPTMTQVNAAIGEGAAYFQDLIEIIDEYRLHVFKDKVIYSVKKQQRSVKEMEDAFYRHEMARQKSLAEKNDNKLDEYTVDLFLRRQAKKFAQNGADMLIRSNRLGWKFVRVKDIDKSLEEEAVKSLKALNLDFGAVDCCTDVNGKHWIIEVNTGPGLEETPFKAWVIAFEENINNILKPKKAIRKRATIKNTAKPTSVGVKDTLLSKLGMATDMVKEADEEDTEVLNRIFSKMFGKK